MAEGILSSIAETVLEKLGFLFIHGVQLYLSFKDDLEKLGKTLSTIRCVLLDAEEQQVKSHAVKDWLGKLKDALYDAEDVFDELSAEALRQEVENHWIILTEVRNFFFRTQMGGKVKEIRERLDEIAEDRLKFHFREQVGHNLTKGREETSSFVHYKEVVGRENDREAVIELLLGNGEEVVSVIPIVGMGGLGKTTLTQMVYNDDRVKGYFDLQLWVFISDDFNVKYILQKIITAATGDDHANLDMDGLQNRVREVLDGKIFLLVLDDVWNESYVLWVKLRDFLAGGANGSKIVVTTRNKNVAAIMGTISSYNLAGLADGDCWSLFEKWAFKKGEGVRHPNLVSIGKQIVSKCGGVPLALRTLGSLLYLTSDERYWLSVKESEIWDIAQKENDILPVLQLSYDQMPSYLKQCFAYCSLLPMYYEIDKDTLIQLWMAQGFIQSPKGNQQLEDIGNLYFNELLSRSLCDTVHENDRGEISKCKMPDLVHDLAKLVAGNECLAVKFGRNNISDHIRHLSFNNNCDVEETKALLKVLKLRTLFLPSSVGNSWKSFFDVLASSSSYLRVLDLSYSDIKELPNSVGDLKHLRYLNLTGNYGIKFLPDSICKLLNLQTLKLLGCVGIHNLPNKFGNLVSLRHLIITSPKMRSWEKQIGSLTSLQSLALVHCDNLLSLSEEIQHLTALRRLRIHHCGKLASFPRSMKTLTVLENLEIVSCSNISLSEECMQGLDSLRSLTIIGLPKLVTLPRGLEHCAGTLQHLTLRDCHSLMTLPNCQKNLTSLRRLHLSCCPNLLYLPEGFHHLTALQVLCIDNCPCLSARCERDVGEDWSKIAHIQEIYVDKRKM